MSENSYLPKQMSGPISRALDNALIVIFGQTDLELSFMHDLTMQTATTDLLAAIGLLVGCPWPSAPVGTFDNDRFTFGAASQFPVIN